MQSSWLSSLELEALPNLPLPQRDRLPDCPAVYFALDSKGRVLYVGKAINLLNRWQDHHRLEQLARIHKRSPVHLAWLDCAGRLGELDAIEAHCIEQFKPLLNRTPVPAKKITPAEVALQETLIKIAKYTVVFGIAPASAVHLLPTVNIRYLGYARVVNTIRRIFKASNNKPTGLNWTEFKRRKYGAWWRTRCNGIAIELGPWTSFGEEAEQLKQNAMIQRLAGIELFALAPYQLQELIDQFPFLAENYPGITALEADPIRLIWATLKQEFTHPEQSASPLASSADGLNFTNPDMNNPPSSDNFPVVTQSPQDSGIRRMDRTFLRIEEVEVEICKDIKTQKFYVRHNLYWGLIYGNRNPDFERNRVRIELKSLVNSSLSTIRWVGYDFSIERVLFVEDGMEVDVILFPLMMFEDLMRHWSQYQKQVSSPSLTDPMKIGQWLEQNSIAQLLPITEQRAIG